MSLYVGLLDQLIALACDYSTLAATVAAIAAAVAAFFAVGLSVITLLRDLKSERRHQSEVDARVSALANAARNGVEGLRENLKLIPNPPVVTLSLQLESWLTRLDPLMLRLAEEFPAASVEKARQIRSATGYFYLVAGELRAAFGNSAALLKVQQQCTDRLGLLYTALGSAMAPEMIVGRGAPVATLRATAHGEASQKPRGAS